MRDTRLTPAPGQPRHDAASTLASMPAGFTPPQAPLKRPWYAPAGDLIRSLFPGLFGLLRNARRQVWRQARIGLLWLAGFAALALIAFVAIGPGPLAPRLVLGGGAAGLAGLVALGVFSLRLRSNMRALSAENRRLTKDIAHIHDLAAGREARVDRIIAAQLDAQLRTSGPDELRALRERVAALARAQKVSEARLEALSSRLDEMSGRLSQLNP